MFKQDKLMGYYKGKAEEAWGDRMHNLDLDLNNLMVEGTVITST